MRKIDLSKDLLHSLYVDQKMTTNKIAEELGVSRSTVSNKLSEYGIEIRNSNYMREQKKHKKRKFRRIPDYRNKEKFEKTYLELKAIDLVADYFGMNIKTAFEWKKRHGIKTIKEFSHKSREKINCDKP